MDSMGFGKWRRDVRKITATDLEKWRQQPHSLLPSSVSGVEAVGRTYCVPYYQDIGSTRIEYSVLVGEYYPGLLSCGA